jgi:hypothetical protein
VFLLDAETAKDMTSGLTWQRHVPASSYDYSAATAYCENLAIAAGDWRLPSFKELQTIYDLSYSPKLDPVAFPNTPQDEFWTSTEHSTGYQLTLGFYGGQGSRQLDELVRVRCVR